MMEVLQRMVMFISKKINDFFWLILVQIWLQNSWAKSFAARLWINSLRPSDAYICVGKLTIIGSDNGLSPSRRQAIIWTNAGILLIGALGTNVSEILIKIDTFSLKKMHLKMTSGKRRPSCFSLNVLNSIYLSEVTSDEISNILKSLKNCAAAYDEMNVCLLKHISPFHSWTTQVLQ